MSSIVNSCPLMKLDGDLSICPDFTLQTMMHSSGSEAEPATYRRRSKKDVNVQCVVENVPALMHCSLKWQMSVQCENLYNEYIFYGGCSYDSTQSRRSGNVLRLWRKCLDVEAG